SSRSRSAPTPAPRTSRWSPRWTWRRARGSRRSTLRPSPNTRKSKAERAALDAGALRTYVRLLAYARPHWPMFLLGVLGMVMYASVDTGFAILTKKFLDGAFVVHDPRMLYFVPAGIVFLFLV